MDFGLDQIFFDLIKQHWLAILGFLCFVALINLLPDIVQFIKNKKRFEAGKKWRTEQELLQWLKDMKPYEFEKYTAELFRRLGYFAEVTQALRDGGVDVVLEKDGRKSYIQCKKYYTSKVTEPQVREFYGALADKLADGQGFIVTTNIFTLDAQNFAKYKPIELVDGPRLVKYINSVQDSDVKGAADRVSLVCPKCGGNLVERKGSRGKFLGCSTFPKCHFTKSLSEI